MSTFTNKQLGIGALSTVLTTTLYTVAALTKAIVTSIVVVNNNTTTTRAVTIKWGPGTKRSVLAAYPLAPGETLAVQVNGLLEAADVIQGGQDVGTDVDYTISGVEIT